MLHVTYSNRAEELLKALAGSLAREGAERHPFDPAHIVVPNRSVEMFVKLGVAQARGIAANLEIVFLRELLSQVAEASLPGTRVADGAQVEAHLLALFHDGCFLGAPVFAPVRDYLDAAGDSAAALDKRRWQLAAQLAPLFDEYAVSRPEMLEQWTAGKNGLDAVADEEWQRALWLAVFGPKGRLAQRSRAQGVTWMPLGSMLQAAQAKGGLDTRGLQPAVHVFGISYLARGYLSMLAVLGRHTEVYIYTINPCREFWEDVGAPGAGNADDAGADNDALRLWSRPGREYTHLLNEITGSQFDARFVAHGDVQKSLLAWVQDDILDRVARDVAVPDLCADGTIGVLPCPGLRRECEVVAAEIWRMVNADPSLRFNEIAVVVPEARKPAYLANLDAVFGESHELPHNVIDPTSGGGHRIADAFGMLLALPLGSFSRKELLPLMTHPSLMAGFPGARAADWLRLCDELGIVHGADRADHRGTYIERDVLNWDQGLRRLVLGQLMTGPSSGGEEPVMVNGQAYLPAEPLPGQDGDAALSFALLARSLIEDARFAAGTTGPRQRPLRQWLEFIRGLGDYLVPGDDGEQAWLARCLREIDGLQEGALEDLVVSYQVAAAMVQRILPGIAGAHGQLLASGVTVSPFMQVRAIPFRVVFVMGLSQGEFPSAAQRAELDLRGTGRCLGDVTPREQDLYMFLEMLLGARERFVLSYVARDEVTGVRLPPSAVVLDLLDMLAGGYLVPREMDKLRDPGRMPPLRRFDDVDRLEALPGAWYERTAKDLGQEFGKNFGNGTRETPGTLGELRQFLPGATFTNLAASLDTHVVSAVPPVIVREPGRIVVPLAYLRRFLEDPLQGSARYQLRLRDADGVGDIGEQEDELFAHAAGVKVGLLRRAVLGVLGTLGEGATWADVSRDHLVDEYRRIALAAELSGNAPTGLFASVESLGAEAVLHAWWPHLRALGGDDAGRARSGVVTLGGAREFENAGTMRDPIVLEAPSLRVEIVGSTDLMVTPASGPSVSVILSGRQPHKGKHGIEKACLRAFLDHVALSAAEVGLPGASHDAVIVWADGGGDGCERRGFAPIERERAREYLAALVADMLAGVHNYLLPCEAVFAAHKSGKDVTAVVADLCDAYAEGRGGFSSVYGPVRQAISRYGAPPPHEAAEMVKRRFGLFFDLLVTAGEEGKT